MQHASYQASDPKLLLTIFQLLRGAPPTQQTDKELHELWDVVIRQQVAATFQPLLCDEAFRASCPASLLVRVDRMLASLAFQREKRVAAYAELAANLRQRGIDVIFLKGLLFAHRYYGDIRLRRARDIDLLVRESQLSDCVDCLQGLGYTLPLPRSKALSSHTRRQEHAITLDRGDEQVDVHWRFRNAHCREVAGQPIVIKTMYRLDYEHIWRSRETCRWQGIDFPALPAGHDLLLLLLSMAQDLDRASCRIRHAVDAWHILKHLHERLDWPAWLEQRRRDRTLRSCVNGIDLVLRWFDAHNEFPRITASLVKHQKLVVETDHERALQLLAGARNNSFNHDWFTRVHPTWQWNSTLRFLRRNVLQPGRLPWLLCKMFLPRRSPWRAS